MRYEVLSGASEGELANNVTKALMKGAELVGGVAVVQVPGRYLMEHTSSWEDGWSTWAQAVVWPAKEST